MKLLKNIFLFSGWLFLLACIEEIPEDNKNFVKFFGKESGTFGKALYELPNGKIILGCKVDVPAFDFNNMGGSFTIGRVVEGSMALIESDKNGLQTDFLPLPVSDHPTTSDVQLDDLAGKSIINEFIPTSDGGYLVSAEWRGFSGIIIINGDTLEVEPAPDVVAPFIMKVGKNGNIEFIRSFNGETDWDGTYHAHAKIRLLKDGTVGVLLGVNVYDLKKEVRESFEGYSFLKLDQQGNVLYHHDFYQPELKIKLLRDFLIDEDDNFIGIGQYNDDMRLFVFNLNTPENESTVRIDDSGVFTGYPNLNDFYIEEFTDGTYVVAYPNPGQGSKIALVPNRQSVQSPVKFSFLNEYPRAMVTTSDDHILVYTEYLAESTVPQGFLYKLNKAGRVIFRIPFEGTPGSVIESHDGSYLVLSNPLFNGLIPKARLTKLSNDGKTY